MASGDARKKICRREKASFAAMQRMEAVGSPSDKAHIEGAVYAGMAECGAECTRANTCLANKTEFGGSRLLKLYVELFEEVAEASDSCLGDSK